VDEGGERIWTKEVRMSKITGKLLRMGFILLAVLLCVSLIALPACTSTGEQQEEEEEEEVITLRIATFFGSTTDQCVLLDDFADALESESGGLLDIERYWGGTLGTAPEMYPAAADGSIDIVFVPLLYTPGRFPPMDVFSQPLGIPSAWAGSHAVQDVWNEFQFEEFDDTHPLFFSISAPLVIYSTTAIRTVADASGLEIRTGPPNNCVLTSVGIVPIVKPMPDVPDAIAKGEIDGVMIGCDGFTAWNLQDVLDYTTLPYVGGGDVFITTMSNDAWNSLPAALQQVVTDVSDDYADEVCQMWADTNQASLDIGVAAGVELITLSAAERDAWIAATAGCSDAWVTSMEGKGYAASDVAEWVAYAQERVDYWIQEQIDEGIPFHVGYPP
jgi:TRAP-type C4-dicarboxylate transport system substrate-binding protein